MPFNVASIKDRASRAKDSTVNKLQNTKDKYSSTPMAKTKFAEGGYVPDARNPPPPPPARSSFASSSRGSYEEPTHSAPIPPSVSLNTKPKSFQVQHQHQSPAVSKPPPPPRRVVSTEPDIEKIDWANLSDEDRKEFFNWLDEFFERFLSMKNNQTARVVPDIVMDQPEENPVPPTTEGTVYSSASPGRGPPPVVKKWLKPVMETETPKSGSTEFEMSYPPQTTHGCQALDFAYYFHPSTPWDDYWYAEENAVPPPIKESMHRIWRGQMMSMGDTKTINYGVLFSDLSVCWWSVSYSMSNPSQVERHAEYIPPPAPLSREQLIDASEMYGETIAAYAESFLGSGHFCARGECWDLANEGIKYLEQYDYVPKPLQSMNRTHGQLIFKGQALGKGAGQVGQWTAADDRARRGDIIEWKSVKIATVGAQYGAYSILGDPDHTAVISKDTVPSRAPREGESFLPSELVAVEVVEQGRNNIPPEPKRQTYDMEAFEQGEVWIYRPVPYEVFMGFPELTVRPPKGIQTETIC